MAPRSQYHYVTWKDNKTSTGTWCAQVTIDGQLYYLGRNVNDREAARLADAKLIEVHGLVVARSQGLNLEYTAESAAALVAEVKANAEAKALEKASKKRKREQEAEKKRKLRVEQAEKRKAERLQERQARKQDQLAGDRPTKSRDELGSLVRRAQQKHKKDGFFEDRKFVVLTGQSGSARTGYFYFLDPVTKEVVPFPRGDGDIISMDWEVRGSATVLNASDNPVPADGLHHGASIGDHAAGVVIGSVCSESARGAATIVRDALPVEKLDAIKGELTQLWGDVKAAWRVHTAFVDHCRTKFGYVSFDLRPSDGESVVRVSKPFAQGHSLTQADFTPDVCPKVTIESVPLLAAFAKEAEHCRVHFYPPNGSMRAHHDGNSGKEGYQKSRQKVSIHFLVDPEAA